MHFIITGGAGFIGSHVTEQLLQEGHYVTVVDNLTTGNLKNLPEHPSLMIKQQNILTCKPEDFNQPIDGIAHLAATPSVTESWLNPLEAHHNNLSATVAVLQLCQSLSIPRLVFASSAAVYGNMIELPISEKQLTQPISPYGLQKLVSEQYANLFAEQLGLSFIALRLFNVFGPRQLPNSPYSGVISIFTKAMQHNLPITIYGDGMQTRDFVFVKDVARAFVQALTISLPGGSTFSCNVGTGKTTSLLELLHILKGCFLDWKQDVKFASARPGDIKYSQASISKIMALLKFTPENTVKSGLQLWVESVAREVSP
jgi:UDP-glucose 4-epimerase